MGMSSDYQSLSADIPESICWFGHIDPAGNPNHMTLTWKTA